MRRSRAPLALMELTVMLLVFALAAALCLQAFVVSSRQAAQSQARDTAVRLAQTAAETLKAAGGTEAEAESAAAAVSYTHLQQRDKFPGLGGEKGCDLVLLNEDLLMALL